MQAEKRIKALDKIIQNLYEDKVVGKISEERYMKMSDNYEAEQNVHTIEIIYNFVEAIDLPDFDAHLREEN